MVEEVCPVAPRKLCRASAFGLSRIIGPNLAANTTFFLHSLQKCSKSRRVQEDNKRHQEQSFSQPIPKKEARQDAMPPLLTQVARVSDALPLVATQTPTHSFNVTTQVQQDAKKLMRSMTAGYVHGSVSLFCWDDTNEIRPSLHETPC